MHFNIDHNNYSEGAKLITLNNSQQCQQQKKTPKLSRKLPVNRNEALHRGKCYT